MFNLTQLGLPLTYHRIGGRVRAWNVMGYVEGVSDGLLVVPTGPSTGVVSRNDFSSDAVLLPLWLTPMLTNQVFRGPDCSAAKNLLVDGAFELLPISTGPIPAAFSSSVVGTWFSVGGAALVGLPPPLGGRARDGHGLSAVEVPRGGEITAVVRTVAGQQYTLKFEMAAYDASGATASVVVTSSTDKQTTPLTSTSVSVSTDAHSIIADDLWTVRF